MSDFDLNVGQYLSIEMIFRGDILIEEINPEVSKMTEMCAPMPTKDIRCAISKLATAAYEHSVTFLGNHTGIRSYFQRVLDCYHSSTQGEDKLINAFVGHGMEKLTIAEAHDKMQSLIEDYQHVQ